METLPNDFLALALVVFVLGLKHGFDADHLATIDGLTRYNSRANPRLARFCGTLFSLGHGAVVVVIALVVSLLAQRWQTPEWLEISGAVVSIGFLLGLGIVNLWAVLKSAPDEIVQPLGFKGRFLGALTQAGHPWLIALVGALFAISFDTISQAALFALTAAQFGGWRPALALGLIFMIGMLATDGLNGFWISRLIRRADQVALIASRVMSLVVASLSILVGAFGIARFALPAVDRWSEGYELFFGLTVIAIVAGSYLLARRLTRQPALATYK